MVIVVILIYSLIKHLNKNKVEENLEESVTRQSLKFKWYNEGNDTDLNSENCRNSIQGKSIIADDRGYLCKRSDVLASGCCKIDSPTSKRYSCETCKSNDCCAIYEYCISCCMNPEKKEVLQKSLVKVVDKFKILLGSVNDQFSLCLVKCRTSSQSVLHENTYRDAQNKHCFGVQVPSIHALG